ncbi:MAG: ABC transporter substrate-binding protein [Rhodobacteraceae bacterium]|nr:ABC transporter substrate-binding protein [Paracoccaceae bacterium]
MKSKKPTRRRGLRGDAGGAVHGAPAAAEGEQFIPMLAYRVGPYAAGGSGMFGGFEDYLALLNVRDGGINGVKLTWEECETEYNADRGVECYERLKGKGETGGTVIHPLSTGITYRLIERATEDKIPIVSLGYGRTDATDGRVFPYIFPLITNYWSQNTAKIKFIGEQEGGMDKLKGKKIANVYHESSYGKETIPILDKQAEIYGFEVKHYAVPHPGQEQKAIWLDLARRYKPDWSFFAAGRNEPTALTEAARVGFPADHIVGVWWSGAEEDVIPAKDAAKGFIAAGFHPGGTDFPVIQEVIKDVQDAGKGNVERNRVGTIYYNRGIIHGIVTAEAIRTAQEKFGKRPITGEEMRWGLENLNITAERIKELGAEGLMQPLDVTCADHEGAGNVKFQQWDGEKWVVITDWISADRDLLRPIIEESAGKYAVEKGITPRTGMSMGSDCG